MFELYKNHRSGKWETVFKTVNLGTFNELVDNQLG